MSQTNKTLIEQPPDELRTPPPHQPETTPLDQPISSVPAAQETKTRPGAVTILGLLLLLQAVGLFDLGLFFFSRGLGLRRSLIVENLITAPVNTLAMGVIFIPLSVLGLLAAIGFFRLWRMAWIIAMLGQGLSLLTALVLYFDQRPHYVYIIMLYSIFMVIYLNYSEIYALFEPSSSFEEEDEG